MTAHRSVLLRGLPAEPLSAYLGALGVLRICATQIDPSIRGAFTHEGFKLENIDDESLIAFLLETWQPSTVLTPWNNASGFYDSPKGRIASQSMDALLADASPRFEAFRGLIPELRGMIRELGYTEAPEEGEKARFIASLRNVWPDESLDWLEAVAVVDGDDVRMMPLLGSGGNEGVLDYSGLFLRSLNEMLLGDRSRSDQLLSAALFGTHTEALIERPGGQFEPGTAGGFNTGPGFEWKNLPNNPWAFILLIEGSLIWTSGLASRQQGTGSGRRFAASPFTVRHSAAGYGSAGPTDDDAQRTRAEVWMPVWRRSASLAEVCRLIAEGRAEVGSSSGRAQRALDSLDFVDAVASMGVDRGIDSFVRYAFIKRRGDSYIALNAGAASVHYRREVDLLRQLDVVLRDVDRFLNQFPSEQGPPAQYVGMRRAIHEACFDVAQRGGSDAMIRLVRAIGRLEMTLARRDLGKAPKLPHPLGGLSAQWVDYCGDSPEVRIAAAIASIMSSGGAAPIRAYLAPVNPDGANEYLPSFKAPTWAGADFPDRLANILQRRLLDIHKVSADSEAGKRSPTLGSRELSAEDVALFLSPDLVDDPLIEELLFGFTWVRHSRSFQAPLARPESPPLPRIYALLKLLFFSDLARREPEKAVPLPDTSIVPLLRAGRLSKAVEVARHRLIAMGLKPRRVTDIATHDDSALGRRIAAALLLPMKRREHRRLQQAALLNFGENLTHDNLDNLEMTDGV